MTKKISDLPPGIASRDRLLLLVEVEFGVPSRRCANYGICRIEVARGPGRPMSSRCRNGRGLALASASEEMLQLAFLSSSLSEQARERHFGRGCFQVEEAFPLPPFLYQQLKLPATTIASGEYRVLEQEIYLIVPFLNLIIS